MIRPATPADVPALAALEERCFDTDRLSARSFRHAVKQGNASLILDDDGGAGTIRGYSLILFHRNTSLARLYSFAVLPEFRRLGIAKALLAESEAIAVGRDASSMRLEVRVDNEAAIAFYRTAGYRQFSTYPDYYEDHVDALRMEKRLVPHLPSDLSPVPYYPQTLEFTCGPACVMMAMKALRPQVELDRMLELRLWREATTIFMTSGHGGCGPFGLALSAWNRGFDVDLHVSDDIGLFVDTVRSEEKKQVIRLVQEDMLKDIAETGIRVSHVPLSLQEIRARFEEGAIPVVLVSTYRLTGDKAPHWVTVTGFDEHFVYIHEPYVDREEDETETMCMGIPIPQGDFERMMRYGRTKQHAVILIKEKAK